MFKVGESKMKRIVLGLMGIVLLCCASSQANVLVSFNFDNGTGDISMEAAGLMATPFASVVGSANWVDHPGNGKAIGAVGFKDSGNYFTFTLTVPAGYKVDVTGLQFDDVKENGMNASNWLLKYQVGSGPLTNGPGGSVHSSWASNTAALSGLTNLQNTTLIFRLAPTSPSNNTKHWYLDNATLSGTVTVVPEPATVAILALGGLALLRKRK